MPASLSDDIEATIGRRPLNVQPLSGGCVGEVYLVGLGGDTAVVKVDPNGADGVLDVEGRMLTALRERGPFGVPEVWSASPALLVMSYVEHDGRRSDEGEAEAADKLAALHSIGADAFGFDEDTLIGGLVQPNPTTATWPAFYGEQRLMHFGRLAEDRRALPRGTLARLETLTQRLDTIFDTTTKPGLVHGDLWSGNVLRHRGRVAALIDPALHYADPEVELAFIDLFSAFGEAFWRTYNAHRPIGDNWPLRCDVLQLAPLLVHACLFGGSYGSAVAGKLERIEAAIA